MLLIKSSILTNLTNFVYQYIGCWGIAGASGSGMSVTTASVVRSVEDTEAAF